MNIDQNFPIPVLGNSSDYIPNQFKLSIRKQADSDTGLFTYKAVIDMGTSHSEIEELAKNKKIKFVITVYCQSTFYRKNFDSHEKTLEFTIPVESLNLEVNYRAYIIASENINNFKPLNVDDVFNDALFEINEGDIVGVSNQTKEIIDPIFKKQNKKKFKIYN